MSEIPDDLVQAYIRNPGIDFRSPHRVEHHLPAPSSTHDDRPPTRNPEETTYDGTVAETTMPAAIGYSATRNSATHSEGDPAPIQPQEPGSEADTPSPDASAGSPPNTPPPDSRASSASDEEPEFGFELHASFEFSPAPTVNDPKQLRQDLVTLTGVGGSQSDINSWQEEFGDQTDSVVEQSDTASDPIEAIVNRHMEKAGHMTGYAYAAVVVTKTLEGHAKTYAGKDILVSTERTGVDLTKPVEVGSHTVQFSPDGVSVELAPDDTGLKIPFLRYTSPDGTVYLTRLDQKERYVVTRFGIDKQRMTSPSIDDASNLTRLRNAFQSYCGSLTRIATEATQASGVDVGSIKDLETLDRIVAEWHATSPTDITAAVIKRGLLQNLRNNVELVRNCLGPDSGTTPGYSSGIRVIGPQIYNYLTELLRRQPQ